LKGQPGGARDHRSWIYTSLDGGRIPSAELEAARRDMDPRSFRQEYEASFEHYAGRVYYAFERAGNVRPLAAEAALPLHVGMDFHVNPMSAVVLQERADGELWLLDEIVLPTSNTDEMAAELARRHGRAGFDPGRPELAHITIYPDPAGTQRRSSAQGRTDIGILRERGFRVRALDSHPPVRDRVNLVNAKLLDAQGRRRLLVDPRCRQTIECLEKLCYREGTNLPDKDGGFDHLPDALGYYLYTRFAHVAAREARVGFLGR
jgi:hypothetical protein